MKIINIVMAPALMATLFAGCAMQPEDEQIDETTADPTSQADTPVADEPAGATPDGGAAAAEGKPLGDLSNVSAGLVNSTWFTGTIAAGATGHWWWNNAPLDRAFAVGLSPSGASTSASCQLEVTRTWDVQQPGGEREFHFEIKNRGTIACGANILLAGPTRFATWATEGIAPGASTTKHWNNATPLTASHIVGISPTGATSTTPCALEVTRTWYAQQPSGEREFWFTIKNVGTITCQGDIQLAMSTNQTSSWSTGTLAVGASKGWTWNNAPLSRVYVPGLSPAGASGLEACVLEVTQSYHRQVINTDGSAEREFVFTVKNVGTLDCFGTVLLNHLD